MTSQNTRCIIYILFSAKQPRGRGFSHDYGIISLSKQNSWGNTPVPDAEHTD